MKEKLPLYPLKFDPILKEKVWGGNKLSRLFNKKGEGCIGESWEVSGVEENISQVINGPLTGSTLNQLIINYKANLVGDKVYAHFGDKFPLLFKFIDAKQDLSVQLHPDDRLAGTRHNSFGKTEMWYIMDSDQDARLILGFSEKMDEAGYLKAMKQNQILDILHSEPVSQGDAFFIAPGTVHAIGAGVVLAEIQQTSDITYRIYDWDRPGIDGSFRDLHTDLAVEAISYKHTNAKLEFSEKKNQSFRICKSPYFETNKFVLDTNVKRDLSKIDSFVVYMCVEGSATLEAGSFSEEINRGESILVPAVFKHIEFITSSASFLEVYIP